MRVLRKSKFFLMQKVQKAIGIFVVNLLLEPSCTSSTLRFCEASFLKTSSENIRFERNLILSNRTGDFDWRSVNDILQS